MIIKEEIRIVGWDDGNFKFKSSGKVIVVGVIFRGGSFMDGVLKTEVEIDGTDATKKISESVKKSKFEDLRIIMLDGITFGGFNVVDIREINRNSGLPVIAVSRKRPNIKKFLAGIKKLPNAEDRISATKNAGKIYEAKLSGGKLYFQCSGIDYKKAEEAIRLSATRSLLPEPLRVAHLIATGITRGESVGRA